MTGRVPGLVAILGSPRSGTTWLLSMLAEHPDVVSTPETYLFPNFLVPLLKAWRAGLSAPVGLDKAIDESAFRQCCRDFGARVLEQIAARRPGARVVVEKTPANALVAREILELFPDARLVHVLRDPRDVVVSIRAAGRSWGRDWAPSSTVEAVRMWVLYVSEALAAEGSAGRMSVVRYEQLHADCARELARICTELGLSADPDWCRVTAERQSFGQQASRRGSGPGEFLRRGETGSWRAELSAGDLRIVEHVAGTLMDRLGYPLSLPPSSRKPLRLVVSDALRGMSGRLGRLARTAQRRALGLPAPGRP